MEDESINRLFYERGYHLFVPIPSLALHMQYSTEEDPLINWREWWDKYNLTDRVEVPKDQRTVLNVGSGRQHITEAIYAEEFAKLKEYRLDINNETDPDIIGSATDLSNIDNDSFDVVYSSHLIEHLDDFDVPVAIKEFLRVTKPGGQVRMITPDLKSIAQRILDGKLDAVEYNSPGGPISPLDMIYGHRASVLNGSSFMRHRTGFTKETFERILIKLGLKTFTVEDKGYDLIVNITK
jgi:ubiquinone/menaquinone biosynthesis C-methylase UbiE